MQFAQVACRKATTTFLVPSSSKAVKNFEDSEGGSFGDRDLAIANYELYIPDIKKLAEAQKTEIEVIYPEIGVYNNFPAQVIAEAGSDSEASAKAFIAVALTDAVQTDAIKANLRPAKKGAATLPDFMSTKIGRGEAPDTLAQWRAMWAIAEQESSVPNAHIVVQ